MVFVVLFGSTVAFSTQAIAEVETTVLDGLGNQSVLAVDINNKTQIVGSAIDEVTGLEHAIIWEDGGVMDLGTLGGPCSIASAIDEGGVNVAGSADVVSAAECSSQLHAFLWRAGEMIDLGTLGGPSSNASDVNKNGVVVGNADTDNCVAGPFGLECETRGFRWHRGTMENLGTLGGANSFANAVNNRGVIVGSSETGETRTVEVPWPPFSEEQQITHAVVWMDGAADDIHPSGWEGDSTAVTIVESGEIIILAFPPDFGPAQVFSYRNGKHEVLPADGVGGYNEKGQLLTSAFDPTTGAVARVTGKRKNVDMPNPFSVAFGSGIGGFSLAGLNDRHQAIGNAFAIIFFPTFSVERRAVFYDFNPGN
jgi:probable HAF family extracellular repeat protein